MKKEKTIHLQILKNRSKLTLHKRREIDIINNKSSKFYKIKNFIMQRYSDNNNNNDIIE